MRIIILLIIFYLGCISNSFAEPPSAENFGKLPAIYDAALSPNGDKIAAIVNYDGKYAIRISSVNNLNLKAKNVVLGQEIKPEYIKWVNDVQVITSLWKSEQISTTPIRSGYLYSLNTKSMVGGILVDPSKAGDSAIGSRLGGTGLFRQFNNVVVDWLEGDPDHILMAYSNSNNNNLQPSIQRVNVVSGEEKVLKGGQEGIQSWYTDLSGTPRIGQGRLNNSNATWTMRIKDSTGDIWRNSDEYPGLNADANIVTFTADPNELVISDYNGKNTLGLYVYSLSSKSITRKIYHNEKYDASDVVLSKDGSKVIGAKYTADSPQTEMLGSNDTILQAMRRKFPGFVIDHVDQAQDGQTVLFKLSNSYTPGQFMMVSGLSGTPQNLGFIHPSLAPATLGEVIKVSYAARDGQKIPSYVTLPPTVKDTAQIKKLPFIVLPHGGPYARDSQRFDYFSQFFASRGYGVLQMNFRGSAGYGRNFSDAGRKNWIVMQEDVEDGTRWLFEKGYADPERTCIAGWSYGGYASLMGAMKNPELYNCAIAMAAMTDIGDFIRDQGQYRFGKQAAKRFIGDGFKNKDDIKANSPVKLAQEMIVPLFLAHGKLDQQVHFDQYKRLKRALKKSKAKVTYMEFKNEDHYLSNQKNRIDFFEGLDSFLSKHNGKSEFSP